MKSYNYKKLFLILLLICVISLGIFWLFWKFYDQKELKKEKQNTYALTKVEKAKIQAGDIILRRGFGFVSDYIVDDFEEEYKISHCGIICKKGTNFSVIHSESSSYFTQEGILEQDFDDFVKASHQNSVIIVRFNQCETTELNKISKRAYHYLKRKVIFDYSFNMKDSSEMYCAEIIWHIFLDEFDTDIYKFPGKEIKYDQFANFWDETYFDIILNHQTQNR